MANALACSFLESDGEVSALRPEWEVLSRMAGSSDLLLSFGWYMAWRSVFGARLRNGVVAFRRNSALVGVMPLMLGRTLRSPSMVVRHDYLPGDDAFLTRRPRVRFIPVRQLSPVLGLEATLWRGGPLAAPGNEADCYAALLRFLQEFSGWDVAVLPLPDSVARALATRCGEIGIAARIDTLDRPMYRRLDLPPWATFLKGKQRHFRRRYDEATKRAQKAGLAFRTFAGPAEIGPGLAVLADVAARSWKAEGRAEQAVNVPYTPASRAFFEMLCLAADDGAVPVVLAIYQGQDPKGALLSMRFGRRFVLLLTFFDPSMRHVSLGRLLIKMAYEWAVDHGVAEIDFNSNSPFAAIYADHHETYQNLTLFSAAPRGRLVHALSRCAGRGRQPTGPAQPSEDSDSCQTANP